MAGSEKEEPMLSLQCGGKPNNGFMALSKPFKLILKFNAYWKLGINWGEYYFFNPEIELCSVLCVS